MKNGAAATAVHHKIFFIFFQDKTGIVTFGYKCVSGS